MRYLQRIDPLPTRVAKALESYQQDLDRRLLDVNPAKARAEIIDGFWKNRRESQTLQAIEVALKAMASGIERCMYCDEGHGHQIEHFRPKAHYERQTFEWKNMLWVCGECNTQKNSSFDDRMLDPTSDNPLNHLKLSVEQGRFTPKTSRGRTTLEKLQRLHEQVGIKGRMLAFKSLRVYLQIYPSVDESTRAEIRQIIVQQPFTSVFAAVLRTSREADAADVLGTEILEVLAQHGEMYDWLAVADQQRRMSAIAKIEEIAKRIRVDVPAEGA